MEILRDGVDLGAFFHDLTRAPARVLILDYDGTLAPFREERDEAVPYPGVREVLRELLEVRTSRVVVVTGRAVEVVRSLLALDPEPEIWGSHGWERRVPGEGLWRGDPGVEARAGLDRGMRDALKEFESERVEEKPVSVAVHVRGLSDEAAEERLARTRASWEAVAAECGLEIHRFDGGLELRVPGRDKGTAVEEILGEEPPEAVGAYLGDDLTDEDAFRALESTRVLRILVRPERRDTAADLRLAPPDELMEFLDRWREATRPDRASRERL